MTVPTITVDSVCRRFGIPDLIKIDVEEAEMQVLSGAMECAMRGATRWIVEMHSSPNLPMRTNGNRVLTWCRQTGLSAWYLKEHRLLSDSEGIAHRGRCHLLLQPAAWPFPDWLLGIEQGDSLRVRNPLDSTQSVNTTSAP